MAKKQTFGDKVKKGSEAENKKYVKVIRSIRSKEKNSLKFNENMLSISGDKNIESAVYGSKVVSNSGIILWPFVPLMSSTARKALTRCMRFACARIMYKY